MWRGKENRATLGAGDYVNKLARRGRLRENRRNTPRIESNGLRKSTCFGRYTQMLARMWAQPTRSFSLAPSACGIVKLCGYCLAFLRINECNPPIRVKLLHPVGTRRDCWFSLYSYLYWSRYGFIDAWKDEVSCVSQFLFRVPTFWLNSRSNSMYFDALKIKINRVVSSEFGQINL